MDGAVWTMIAILAGSQIATLVYLGNKIDTRVDTAIAMLGARIDASTADLRADIRDQSSRMDAILMRLTDHELGHRRPRPNRGA